MKVPLALILIVALLNCLHSALSEQRVQEKLRQQGSRAFRHRYAAATTPKPARPIGNFTHGVASAGNRIVGGQAVAPNSIPWQVGLVHISVNWPSCGGTLISRSYVLTAAHCTAGIAVRLVRVVLAEHDTTSDGRSHVISRKEEHPNYNATTLDYDFSMLVLEHPVLPSIAPACLPYSSSNDYNGKSLRVSGWGFTTEGGTSPNVLHAVYVTGITNTECKLHDTVLQIRPSMMCATGNGADACHGDSGGPLTYKSQGVTTLVGVVSFGSGCGRNPGVYARVSSAMPWIEKFNIN